MNIKQQRINFEEWYGIKPKGWFEVVKYNIAWEAWLAAQKQEGYVLVPVEPTEKMLDASRRRQWDDLSSPYEDMDRLKYKAMIKAAQE